MTTTSSSLVFALLLAAISSPSSATWCICKQGISDQELQKTLDYACGTGADCNPIKPNGQCFYPNTVLAHCNYAVNSYFQKKALIPGSCDFATTAFVTTSNPSVAGCAYPTSASGISTGTTPVTTNPTTRPPPIGMPSTATATGGNSIFTPPTTGGVLGVGINTPTPAAGMNSDVSHGGVSLQCTLVLPFLTALITYLVVASHLLQ
ncbi:unnamed protein product [Cuscuta epithymum]|uniref:X8 domain-containing protein n=1 Tax=Cuscuta epithymum TaxID=186058 RepID=A0AAV0FYB6_9ASTE|nr:unnamed protein product [Cuscuta epithymum]CAH9140214.1 unnamed protein product [Cuscuta epithymum]